MRLKSLGDVNTLVALQNNKKENNIIKINIGELYSKNNIHKEWI